MSSEQELENKTLDHMTRFNLQMTFKVIEAGLMREDVQKQYPHLHESYLQHKADFLSTGLENNAVALLEVYKRFIRKPFISMGLYINFATTDEPARWKFARNLLETKKEHLVDFLQTQLSKVKKSEVSADFIDALLREHEATHDAPANHTLSNFLVRLSLFEDILQELAMAA